ncbi:MAG: FtsX-like permease family protein [Candidatus Heimdallarchaeota archaeon]|nr:FtsX-like permease family protein [Candidatus Heimdallarchaeota archaeon]
MVLQTIQFAFKNAFRKKMIVTLSIAGMAIGIALMVALTSASAGFDKILGDAVAKTVGDVEVQEHNKELILSQLPRNISDIIYTINSKDKIIAVSGQVVVNNFYQFADNITLELGIAPGFGPGGESMNSLALGAKGININEDELFEGPTSKIINGRLFENDYEVIIADYILDGGSEVFALNESFDLMINYTYSIPITIVGVFKTGDELTKILEPSFIMSVNTSLLINCMTLPFEQTGYNMAKIRFDSENIEETNIYVEELKALEPKLEVTAVGAQIDSLSSIMDNFATFQTILTIIVIVAGGMAIFVAQLMGVNERMKEFAIMKAIGWKNRTILFNVILESTIIGILGSIVGFALGAGLIIFAQIGSTTMFITITWQIVLKTLAYGLGLGILSGLIPSIKAASVKPMEVIRGL